MIQYVFEIKSDDGHIKFAISMEKTRMNVSCHVIVAVGPRISNNPEIVNFVVRMLHDVA